MMLLTVTSSMLKTSMKFCGTYFKFWLRPCSEKFKLLSPKSNIKILAFYIYIFRKTKKKHFFNMLAFSLYTQRKNIFKKILFYLFMLYENWKKSFYVLTFYFFILLKCLKIDFLRLAFPNPWTRLIKWFNKLFLL